MESTVPADRNVDPTQRSTVGLLTIPRYYNHGTQLQLFALQSAITGLGYDCSVFDYVKEFATPATISARVRAIRDNPLRLGSGLLEKGYAHYVRVRQARSLALARQFEVEELNIVPPRLRRYEDFEAQDLEYDAYVVGSDQLWSPLGHLGDRAFFLEFAPQGKRISYAPSIGVSHLTPEGEEWLRAGVEGIRFLSVREETGARLLREIAGVKAEVVVDPTLLVPRERFADMASRSTFPRPAEPYVLQYTLCGDRYIRNQARAVARSLGCPRVVIPKHRVDILARHSSTIKAWDVGPREFVDLFSGASAVVTDSFHGTVFSILFEVPFFSFRRYEDKSQSATFSRIDDLLRRLGLTARIVSQASRPASADRLEMDWGAARTILTDWVRDSKTFLEASLRESCGPGSGTVAG